MQVVTENSSPSLLLARKRPEGSHDVQLYLRPQATLLRIDETVWHPPTDVFEAEDAFHVKVELGGMDRNDIEVVADEHVLLIRGRRCDTSPASKIRYRQAEIKYGQFEVRLAIPREVDLNLIEAAYHNGFLEVILPRKPTVAHAAKRTVIRIG